MSTFERGTVTRITFEIEYPDGSRKTEDYDEPSRIAMIALDDEHVAAADRATFNASETDWKQNPAMMVYHKDLPAGAAGIPFCTHNGCKQ